MVWVMDYNKITQKKKLLDGYHPLAEALVRNLEDWFRVELTYTSNAIEGNTLTRQETALVVEKGITVGGKSLVEHLEAANHAQALDWVKEQLKRTPQCLKENDVLKIHSIILKGIDDYNCGHYRSVPVRISGSRVVLPNPRKVPELMNLFMDWLQDSKKLHPVELAAQAHYRLVTIHPFVDGNGRTARLLMNMILLMSGYPAAIIRKRDRLNYLKSLEKAQLGGSEDDYLKIIMKAVDRSLDIYLKAVQGEAAGFENEDVLLKIGELAKETGETHSTLRHWTKEGLLEPAQVTEAGYQLYALEAIERVNKIRELQKKRYSLQEIRELLEQ